MFLVVYIILNINKKYYNKKIRQREISINHTLLYNLLYTELNRSKDKVTSDIAYDNKLNISRQEIGRAHV